MGTALVKASPERWVSPPRGLSPRELCKEHLLHHHQPLLPIHHLNQAFHLFHPSLGECGCLNRNWDIAAGGSKAGDVHTDSPPQSLVLSRGGPGVTSHTGEHNRGAHALAGALVWDAVAATQGDTSKGFRKE